MAVVTRFVNTAADPSGDGTTNNTSSGDNTHAYDTFSAWNTGEAADLTSVGNTHIVNCSGTAADTTGNVQMTGWTTDSGDFVTINGDNTAGKYNTSAYRLEYTTGGSYAEGIVFAEGFTEIYDFQMQMTSSHAGVRGYSLTGTECDLHRSIIKGVLSGSPGAAWYGIAQANAVAGDLFSCLALDCIAGDNAPRGFIGISTTTPSFAYNCTAHNCSFGFHRSYLDFTARNCLAQNCTDGFGVTGSGWLNCTHCCSDVTSDAPGTSTQTGSVLFVDEAGDDFQPASGDTVAKENGVDLSGTFNYDLAGNTFNATWDIGCLKVAAAAGGASKLVVLNRHRGI